MAFIENAIFFDGVIEIGENAFKKYSLLSNIIISRNPYLKFSLKNCKIKIIF